jgi:hypothetical protein
MIMAHHIYAYYSDLNRLPVIDATCHRLSSIRLPALPETERLYFVITEILGKVQVEACA